MIDIYIRPLVSTDAATSYKWRNNPKVWQLTGSKPDREVTLAVEEAWIKEVLTRESEKRFAICVTGTDEYVGNVQLTHIDGYKAELHIFIGETNYWGKGLGTQATHFILEFAFETLKLDEVYLLVDPKHESAIKLYEKCGFFIQEKRADQYLMVRSKNA